MITQRRLKKLLHYDPESGEFIWRVDRRGNVHAGSVAGYLHPYGYIHIGVNGKYYKAHRLAWLYIHGKWPKEEIDHINHIRDDNRIVNLREASHEINGRNRKLSNKNKSGVTGVSWYKLIQKYRTTIQGKHIGYYDTFEEAVKVRKAAEKKHGFHKNHGK